MSDPRMRGELIDGKWYIPYGHAGFSQWTGEVPGPAPARFEYTGEYRLPKQDDYWLSPQTHQMRMDIAYLNEYFDGGKRWILRKVETEFQECAECRAKPGSPQLCDSCLCARELAGRKPEPLKVGDRVRVKGLGDGIVSKIYMDQQILVRMDDGSSVTTRADLLDPAREGLGPKLDEQPAKKVSCLPGLPAPLWYCDCGWSGSREDMQLNPYGYPRCPACGYSYGLIAPPPQTSGIHPWTGTREPYYSHMPPQERPGAMALARQNAEPVREKCACCGGSGMISVQFQWKCPECSGSGVHGGRL